MFYLLFKLGVKLARILWFCDFKNIEIQEENGGRMEENCELKQIITDRVFNF